MKFKLPNMKKLTFLLITLIFFGFQLFAQNELNRLTFDDCENSVIFQHIRNNTRILQYTSADGSVLELGDTLTIGSPAGSITSTTAAGVGNTFGVGKARSRTKESFTTIIMGRPAGVGSVMNAMGGEDPENASAKMQGEVVVISEMKVSHKGSKKKPLKLIILLGEPNGRAFGINKYMSVVDYEKSVLSGEIRSLNAPMTRDEAIAKLKESKDLLDLGLLEEAAYEKLKAELAPIIMEK